MATPRDLFKNLSGSGSGFTKPAAKPLIAPADADKTDAKSGGPGKHFDPSQKGHNLRKGAGGGGASLPTSVRPKV